MTTPRLKLDSAAADERNGSLHAKEATDHHAKVTADALVDWYLRTSQSSFSDIELFAACYRQCQRLRSLGIDVSVDFRKYLGAEPDEQLEDRPYSSRIASSLWQHVLSGTVSYDDDGSRFAVSDQGRLRLQADEPLNSEGSLASLLQEDSDRRVS